MSETFEFAVKPSELSVSIGLPCSSNVPCQTAFSLARTTAMLAARGVDCRIEMVAGSSLVTVARNRVVHSFLQGKLSHLFWIDSDIVWEPTDFLKLLILASQVDVVCGAYPLKNEQCPLAIQHPDLENFEINKHGLVKITGTGLGFTALTRKVVEELVATKPVIYDEAYGYEMASVFRLDTARTADGRLRGRGEDMAFFADVRELGYDVWLDPRVQLGHVGNREYRTDPVAALRLEHIYRSEAA